MLLLELEHGSWAADVFLPFLSLSCYGGSSATSTFFSDSRRRLKPLLSHFAINDYRETDVLAESLSFTCKRSQAGGDEYAAEGWVDRSLTLPKCFAHVFLEYIALSFTLSRPSWADKNLPFSALPPYRLACLGNRCSHIQCTASYLLAWHRR